MGRVRVGQFSEARAFDPPPPPRSPSAESRDTVEPDSLQHVDGAPADTLSPVARV